MPRHCAFSTAARMRFSYARRFTQPAAAISLTRQKQKAVDDDVNGLWNSGGL